MKTILLDSKVGYSWGLAEQEWGELCIDSVVMMVRLKQRLLVS